VPAQTGSGDHASFDFLLYPTNVSVGQVAYFNLTSQAI